MEKSAQTPSLLEVVGTYNALIVEDYQRTYSWQKDQIEELLTDLKDCVTSGDNHFLGTLILQEGKDKSATIVDGQQRLTTIFILVAALRDRLRKFEFATIKAADENERDIDVINKALNFLCFSNKLDDQRFKSSRFLRPILETVVLAEPNKQKPIPTRDNEGKKLTSDFRKAIRQIRDWVSTETHEKPDREVIAWANNLLDAILDRFIVLRVVTENLSESLDIFLTLNNRGLPLGPSDLVRGEIMSVLSSGKTEKEQLKLHAEILNDWTTIVELVKEPETFLRHYLVSTTLSKIQKKKVVREVTTRISGKENDEKVRNALIFWRQLQEGSSIYNQIVQPAMGGDTQYRLELLEGLGKSHRIILLAVFSQEIESNLLEEIVRNVFVLAFRNVMAGLNAQKLEDFYQEQAMSFRKNGDAQLLIRNLFTRTSEINFDVDRYLRNEGDTAFACRALLHAVNRALTIGATQTHISSNEYHLEHIAPFTENEEWAITLFGKDSELRKSYDDVVGQIGNLSLLDGGLNIQAQRKPFNEKKLAYEKSTFMISRDLQNFADWNLENIKLRNNWLSEMFEIIWSVEKSKKKVIHFSKWVSEN